MATDPLAELRAEHRRRLFERFEKRAGTFTTTFGATLTVSLAFAALVLVPYFRLELQQTTADAALRDLESRRGAVAARAGEAQRALPDLVDAGAKATAEQEKAFAAAKESARLVSEHQLRLSRILDAQRSVVDQRARATARISALRTLDNALDAFDLDPAGSSAALGAELRELRSAAAAGRLAPTPACPQADSERRLSCAALARVDAAADSVAARLRAELVDGRTGMDPRFRAALETNIEEFRHALGRELHADGRFGRDADLRRALAGEVGPAFSAAVAGTLAAMRDELRAGRASSEADLRGLRAEATVQDEELAKLQPEFDALAVEARARDEAAAEAGRRRTEATDSLAAALAERDRLAREVDRLNGERDRRERAREEIARRLERLQTPFGTLPIGASDGILAFPLLVAAGFLVSALILADAARLKTEVRRRLRERDPDGLAVDDAQLALVAPLWFDAARPRPARLALAAIFALPPAIAAAAAALLLWDARVAAAPIAPPDMQIGYAALYLVAAGLVAVGVHRVVAAFTVLAAPPKPGADPRALE